MEIYGNIHSIESCGTVDGPGIRFVVFFQGCPMRCLYCHNPDTWSFNVNKKMTTNEILEKYDSVKEFLKNGGLTATGGEPLLQMEFLTELFKKAKEKNIHTTLDTSGILYSKENYQKIETLMQYTDLILLDIKHIDNNEHNKLTGHFNTNILDFARYLSKKNIPVWIRHVVVPTITYNKAQLSKLGTFLAELDNIKALDILPYHNMGIKKYQAINKEYPLKHLQPLTKEQALEARNYLLSVMKAEKLKQKSN